MLIHLLQQRTRQKTPGRIGIYKFFKKIRNDFVIPTTLGGFGTITLVFGFVCFEENFGALASFYKILKHKI
jgi:hypothetical protein